jgi:transcription antitermination protein NusB
MVNDASDKAVKPANQRGAARLAAVQALYQMDVGGSGVLEVVAEYETYRLGQEIDGDQYLKADPSWFRSRLDSTVRAILRAGTFELIERKDVPIAVIVNEYVEIAQAFFEEEEPRLVNAVLDRIAKQVRNV